MQIAVLLSLLTVGLCAPAAKKSPPKISFSVVHFDSSSSQYKTSLKKSSFLKSRAKQAVNVTLENEYALYLAELSIGTPGQKVQVDIDTGSSDLWVPGAGTYNEGGYYDHRNSSTYQLLQNDTFAIGYGDGSGAQGDWAIETVDFGGVQIKNLTFGDVSYQTAGQAILGIGLRGNEASAALSTNNFTYDNLPELMKKQGIINKNCYSLYLNSLDAKSGEILFGAIDKARFSGKLQMLDLVKVEGTSNGSKDPVAFFVNLDSIVADGHHFANKTYPALLDSGTTLIYAPPDTYIDAVTKYAEYNSTVGAYTTPCTSTGPDFVFGFKGKKISVPFKSLLFNLNSKTQDSETCVFGIMNSYTEYYILGDSFLRSAYVYHDLEKFKVGLAQAKYGGNRTNVQIM